MTADEMRAMAEEILSLSGRSRYMDSGEQYVAQAMIAGWAIELARAFLGEES